MQRNYREENRNWNKRGKSGTGKSEGKVELLRGRLQKYSSTDRKFVYDYLTAHSATIYEIWTRE